MDWFNWDLEPSTSVEEAPQETDQSSEESWNFFNNWFPQNDPNATQGSVGIYDRVGMEFPVDFNQETIGAGLADIFKATVQGVATATRDAISNSGTQETSFIDQIRNAAIQRFTSTQTGQEIQQQAAIGVIKNWMTSPWAPVAIGIGFMSILFLLLRK